MLVVGFDPGNSESTLTWRMADKARHMTIPSFVGSGRLDELQRVRSGAGGGGTLEKDELAIETGGASYFVGRLALAESRDASAARNDVSRYWNGHTLKLLLALASAANLFGPIRIMTGLPVSAWTPENKRAVQRALIGTHHYRANGRDRVLVVEAVGVMMEGAAALAAYGLEDVPQAVIDVGGRTTDLFWAQGARPVTARCDAIEAGVEKAGDLLSQDVQAEYKRTLRPHEVRAVLRAAATGATPPTLYSAGQPIHLNGQVGAAIQAVGQQIASYVAQKWGDDRGGVASEAARVVLIGGGAHYFARQLQALIPHLEVAKAPELANALGYLSVGLGASDEAWARNRG